MAERKRNIAITAWVDHVDVWCDFSLKEQFRNIDGVAWIEQAPGVCPNHLHVIVDGCYNLDEVVAEMRELAAEEDAREEQVIDVESAIDELLDRGFVESV